MNLTVVVAAGVTVGALGLLLKEGKVRGRRTAVHNLVQREIARPENTDSSLLTEAGVFAPRSGLDRRLFDAGIWSAAEREEARRILGAIAVIGGATGALLASALGALISPFGLVACLYGAIAAPLALVAYWKAHYRRQLLFFLPLVLESVTLIVEAGLGVIPALERIIEVEERLGNRNPVIKMFRHVMRLMECGVPFSDACSRIASRIPVPSVRHVLLHLDLAESTGGETRGALRSLSAYAHSEWRLSVRSRVKQRETLVVFPVFGAVVGLFLIAAAVPFTSMKTLDIGGAPSGAASFMKGKPLFPGAHQ